MKQRRNNNKLKHFVGNQIRAHRVLCINHNNENCGVVPIYEALKMAEESGLDLVQINNDTKNPTCKILDYNKFRYDLSKKEKLAKKKQRESAIKVKEIKFRPTTDENDLQTKAKHAKEFLDDGNKVKVTIVFRGREMSYRDIGTDTLYKFFDMIEIAQFENEPSMSGRNLSAILCKKKEEKSAACL